MTLSIVERTELRGGLVETGVSRWKEANTISISVSFFFGPFLSLYLYFSPSFEFF